MLPFTSLDAATSAPTVGVAKDMEEIRSHHTVLIDFTGEPSGVGIWVQGSHDGVHWTTVKNINAVVDGLFHSIDCNLRYIRADLASLSGGTAPMVTVTIASL